MRCVFAFLLGLCVLPLHAAPPIQRLSLPPGFHVSVYSDQVPSAREMALGPDGTLYVGSMDAGKVYALTDANHDGRAERVRVIAHGLRMPVGVAFHDGDLYVSAVNRILVLRDIGQHLDDPPQPRAVIDDFPTKRHHGWKFIAFGPDGKLYVPIGAPCNICDPMPPYAMLWRVDLASGEREPVARGVRNSVGFDWQPGSGKLWFTDNGRDMLGDDIPSDELNRVDRVGEHFGYPYCHQGDLPDPQYGDAAHPCSRYAPPALKLGAHVAALGMRFYTGTMFPARYRGAILIAEHGSWNRTTKSGYRVMAVQVKGNRAIRQWPLATGFQQHEKAWGRPADVLVMPDGSVLVSDDLAGAIYRITYTPPGGGR
jgi:glucose/arabinose dehydrogenase